MSPLLLLLLLAGLHCTVLQGQQVTVRKQVTGFVNQEVLLPCTISISDSSIRVSQIMWVTKNGSVAAFSPQHGTHLTDPSRFTLVNPSEVSATLRISPLRATDEGEYSCEVTLFPAGNRKDTTILEVKAVPLNSAEANPAAVANGEEQTVATCRSANGRPPAQIRWSTSLSGNDTTTITSNADGTYTVVSHYMMTPRPQVDGEQITCIISQDSIETPIPLKLGVMYPPEVTIGGYDDNWHLKRNDVYLICNARGNPPTITYTWKTADGSPLPPSVRVKENMLYVNEVDSRVNRSFLCEATNALGSTAYRQDVLVRGKLFATKDYVEGLLPENYGHIHKPGTPRKPEAPYWSIFLLMVALLGYSEEVTVETVERQEKPNYSGAGATGGIIGGIIAAIVGVAVVVTVIMIYRQQRRNQTAKDEEEFEGPPAYKPPPPSIKMQIEKPAEEMPLKSLPPETTDDMEIEKNGKVPPKYQMTPEPQNHSTYNDDDDYLEQENPIYNEFHHPENGTTREEQGFVMSPAVYV